MNGRYTIAHVLAIVGSLLTWFALGAQLWIDVCRGDYSVVGGVWNLLGYFTIITNIAVALVLTAFALKPDSSMGLNAPSFEFSVLTSILLVGGAYLFLLEGRYEMAGLAWWVDRIFHYVVPVLVFVYWFLRPHGKLTREAIIGSTAMPIIYCIYAFIRGYFTGKYPYYFIDPTKFSVGQISLYILGMLVSFVVVAILLYLLDRLLAKTGNLLS